jgi:hypothetical protein
LKGDYLFKYAVLLVLAALLLLMNYALLGAAQAINLVVHIETALVWCVLFWGVILLFVAPLISNRFKTNTVAAVNWILGGGLVVLTVVPFSAALLYRRYSDGQRAAQQVAYQKSICVERVRLNADLVAKGKPPLFPNLTLADCTM